jgi:hypothetical protein
VDSRWPFRAKTAGCGPVDGAHSGGDGGVEPCVAASDGSHGTVLTALGTLAFAWVGLSSNEWLLAASLFVRGAGLSPVTIAVQTGAYRDVDPDDIPDASSTTRIVQQVGGAFGAAVLALILTNALLSHHAATVTARGLAFNTAFWWAIGFTALTLVPALLLPASDEATTPRTRRRGSTTHERTARQDEASRRTGVSEAASTAMLVAGPGARRVTRGARSRSSPAARAESGRLTMG